jgi:hypothetical protein
VEPLIVKDDPAEIMELELRRIAAINTGDLNALAGLLSEDYIHVHATGRVHNKDQLIENLRNAARTIDPRAPKIRVYGIAAVLTGDMTNVMRVPGKADQIKMHLYVTQVAYKSNGVWQFVSFQAVKVAG